MIFFANTESQYMFIRAVRTVDTATIVRNLQYTRPGESLMFIIDVLSFET